MGPVHLPPCLQMAGQFLLLMFFLEKFWFTPVGKVLDERDALIRSKLSSVKDNTGDVEKFAVEAQDILKVRSHTSLSSLKQRLGGQRQPAQVAGVSASTAARGAPGLTRAKPQLSAVRGWQWNRAVPCLFLCCRLPALR